MGFTFAGQTLTRLALTGQCRGPFFWMASGTGPREQAEYTRLYYTLIFFLVRKATTKKHKKLVQCKLRLIGYETIESGKIPQDFNVVSIEPKMFVDFTRQFYLLPIAEGFSSTILTG